MLRVYHEPNGGTRMSGDDLRERFDDHDGSRFTTYEGLNAIEYSADEQLVRRSAVVIPGGASWTGKKLFHLMLQSA